MTAYPEDHLRVTAGQRDQAASVLREATADQRLTFEEFEARLPRALTAVTRRDLYDLLEDLVPSEELPSVIVDAVNLGTAPGMSWDNPYVITAHGWDVRAGRWEMPPFMEVNTGFMSVITLYCMEAVAFAPVIDLSLVGGGRVTLVVPQGWGVDTQQIRTNGTNGYIWSHVNSRPTGGNPRIVMRGQTSNWIRVRHPKPRDLRRAAREARKTLRASSPLAAIAAS